MNIFGRRQSSTPIASAIGVNPGANLALHLDGVRRAPPAIDVIKRMPGLIGLVDPAYTLGSTSGGYDFIRCLLTGSIYLSPIQHKTNIIRTAGGGKLITTENNQHFLPDPNATIVMPRDNWSIFWVTETREKGLRFFMSLATQHRSNEARKFSIGLKGGKVCMFDHAPRAASYGTANTSIAGAGLVICGITMSSKLGIRFYTNNKRNGEHRSKTEMLSPVEINRTFQFFGTRNLYANGAAGKHGQYAFFAEDYSKAEYSTARSVVHAAMSEHYGIALT